MRQADVAVIGSFVPDGVAVARWVLATARGAKVFYDIDTPVTLARLARGDAEYLVPELIQQFDLYLSFTGGPTLDCLHRQYGAPMARVLYCSTDPALYYPERRQPQWDLGYLGTFSEDRQRVLDHLLLEPARQWSQGRFVVAGPLYPDTLDWPANTQRIHHLAPPEHREFYNAQRFTLNVTRADMVRAGYSPSVRLFEAAACGTPIISDRWKGIETFFRPGEEILIAATPDDTLRYLRSLPEEERIALGRRARARVLAEHTAAHRAAQLESYFCQVLSARAQPAREHSRQETGDRMNTPG
jgi:spore maturation protein CgeB